MQLSFLLKDFSQNIPFAFGSWKSAVVSETFAVVLSI